MHIRRIVFLLLSLSSLLLARQNTDVVVMKNGDRLTGEIKGLNAGVRYVSMSYIGSDYGTSSGVSWTFGIK